MANGAIPYPLTDIQESWLAPSRTALCIIDVQEDFASPDGLLSQFGLDMTAVQPAVKNCNALIKSAREAGVAIFFIGLETTEQTDSPAWLEWMKRQGKDAEIESAICRSGSSGMNFYGMRPDKQDSVIYKTKYSAFYTTTLDQKLKSKALDTLVFCGLTTECCVESTVRDAFHRDYHTIVSTDACAAYDPQLHVASLRTMAINFALLSDTQKICSTWEETT